MWRKVTHLVLEIIMQVKLLSKIITHMPVICHRVWVNLVSICNNKFSKIIRIKILELAV